MSTKKCECLGDAPCNCVSKGTGTYRDTPSKSPDVVLSVQEKIREGTVLADEREHDPHNIRTIKPLYNENSIKHLRSATTIRKIVYPEEERAPRCNHTRHMTPNRDEITRLDHINLLAKPKSAMSKKRQYPTIVEKPIECATHRIHQLAQPNKYKLKETYDTFQQILDTTHADNITTALKNIEFVSISQAVEYYMQRKKLEKYRKVKRKRQMKQLKQKFRRMKYKYIILVMKNLYESMRTYLLGVRQGDLTPELILISNRILARICHFMSVPLVDRTGIDSQEHFFVQMADKLAVWALTFATNSNYFQYVEPSAEKEAEFDWKSRGYKEAFPIEAYSSMSSDVFTDEDEDAYTQLTPSTIYFDTEPEDNDKKKDKRVSISTKSVEKLIKI